MNETPVNNNAKQEEEQQQAKAINDKKKADAEDFAKIIQSVSHEVRTPINGVIGFMEMIQQSLGVGSDRNYTFMKSSRSVTMGNSNQGDVKGNGDNLGPLLTCNSCGTTIPISCD